MSVKTGFVLRALIPVGRSVSPAFPSAHARSASIAAASIASRHSSSSNLGSRP
ncbi:hypothetical protein [Microbacterium sp. NIBRBAC000506063]|uniref:hypothetical protein n=1 Tax=Microbacterium sp. NIBRBAC000506063 TaxID=2734618 RepID=UPI001CB705E2|nr:hypothetical protein [Microbacterium sp. NIBRBAC000506063]